MPFDENGRAKAGQVIYVERDPEWRIVAVANFDGMLGADILWRHSGTGAMYLMLMNGFSIVAQGFVNDVPGSDWAFATAGDLVGTGRPNGLVWRHTVDGRARRMELVPWVAPFRVQGAVDFLHVPDFAWRILGTARNIQGNDSVYWWNEQTGELDVRTDNVLSFFHRPDSPLWMPIAFGDYDGDGRGDVVWRHQGDGRIHVMLLRSSVLHGSRTLYAEPDPRWSAGLEIGPAVAGH
jgi:peptidyl-Asp metalloendopeptidase